MRTMLLLGTTTIVLALGCVGAQAVPFGDQAAAPNATFNEQLLTANSGTPAIAGRPALAIDGGAGAPVMAPAKADPTLPFDIKTATHNFIVLAIASVIAGFAVVSAIVSRILDGQAFSPGGVRINRPKGCCAPTSQIWTVSLLDIPLMRREHDWREFRVIPSIRAWEPRADLERRRRSTGEQRENAGRADPIALQRQCGASVPRPLKQSRRACAQWRRLARARSEISSRPRDAC